MALKSNRVGVRTDQVDVYGRVTSKSFLQSILDYLPRWTSLKVWKNGTEQLLPVNTDEPVTSPIVADIQYPTDSSATKQMFTYRESPTDADGEAYIQSIKGNTLVWNQLCPASITSSTHSGLTWTESNGLWSVSGTASHTFSRCDITSLLSIDTSHVYALLSTYSGDPHFELYSFDSTNQNASNKSFNQIVKFTQSGGAVQLRLLSLTAETEYSVTGYLMIIDLTKMFGSTLANEILAMETAQAGSGVAYFRSLFPLPYYQYDAGSLLSFNGTGIKTTGKNIFNKSNFLYVQGYNLSGTWRDNTAVKEYPTDPLSQVRWNSLLIDVSQLNGNLTWSGMGSVGGVNNAIVDSSFNVLATLGTSADTGRTVNLNNYPSRKYIAIGFYVGRDNYDNLQVELGSTATSYEPYTTSTTTIPTDTYFPTGMKSVGEVYDEFTSSRAYTRVGERNLGSLNWTYNGTRFATDTLISDKALGNFNIICSKYDTTTAEIASDMSDKQIKGSSVSTQLYVKDSSYTDATAFKTAMDGVMLQYELAEEIIEPTLEFDEE